MREIVSLEVLIRYYKKVDAVAEGDYETNKFIAHTAHYDHILSVLEQTATRIADDNELEEHWFLAPMFKETKKGFRLQMAVIDKTRNFDENVAFDLIDNIVTSIDEFGN